MLKLQTIARLGRDAMKNDVSGKTVINFTIAHSVKLKEKDVTTWIECAWWTDRTGILPYLTKGAAIYVEGTPSSDMYTSKSGETKPFLRLRVFNVELLPRGADNAEPKKAPTSTPDPISEDDLPF